MLNKKWNKSEEINMTPLLDVLFSVLFIILLSGARVQVKNSNQTQELNNQIESLQNELTLNQNIEETKKQYYEDSLLITVDNVTIAGNSELRIRSNRDNDGEYNSFDLSEDSEVLVKSITDYLNRVIVKDKLVYIMFECDEDNIHTDDYNLIDKIFSEYESNTNYKLYYKKNISGGLNNE